jgi:amino acid permease
MATDLFFPFTYICSFQKNKKTKENFTYEYTCILLFWMTLYIKQTLERTEGTINNRQCRDMGNTAQDRERTQTKEKNTHMLPVLQTP